MDAIDKKMITLLQENCRRSISELASLLPLSRPSVTERLTTLQEKGIITNFTITLDLEKIGKGIQFLIQVSALKIPYLQFVNLLERDERILEVNAVTGRANYIIKAATANIEEMNALLSHLMPYGHIETSVILNTPISYRSPSLIPHTHTSIK